MSFAVMVSGFDGVSLDFVDPLIGTEGTGSQYGGMQPYTCVPFGSFHAVPMTRTNRIGRLSFNSSDDALLGFILTRQPAIWMGDWGEVRVTMPSAKIEKLDAKPYLTRVAAGGHAYEYTATAHAAWIRGLDESTIAAFPESGTNTNRMDAKYGYPLPNFGGRWYADKSRPGELKIGLSLISVEQAKANLAKEIGTQPFDEVVAGTKAQWEEMFSRVVIDAPDDVKTIFYTGLYHTLLYPRQMDECGRYYSAFDNKIHTGTRYNCFSLWDTYRAEHPWLTLIAPERVDGMMQSLVDMYKEGGWLPKWPNPSYTGIMVGAPAEIVLQEAMVKGFKGFDWATAQEAIRKNATVPQEYDRERRWEDRGIFGRAPETRAGLTSYLKRGYVACDETSESVSRTQDFSLADRNKNYTNLWCVAEGMFLPRRADGSFVSRKKLKPPYHDYCEQQPETGVWAVPHDPEGLAGLMGGKAEAIRRLDEFFGTIFFKPDGRGNGSIHGNETSHHCAYLYNRFGAPKKTQQCVRQILTKCYSTNHKGFDGNEDCGQMSAWYILSSLGFYPLDPVSGEYEIGSPLVESAILKIGTATLRIVVKGYAPDRWCVKRVTFNGRELLNWRVKHSDLVAGGNLCFEMLSNGAPTRYETGVRLEASSDVPLQMQIDRLATQGGGTLVLKPGRYESGAIFFKPGVNLHLEEGAVLVGRDDADSYPKRITRIEGETCEYYPALINADHCDGFRITGSGTIDGHGVNTWEEFWRKWTEARSHGKDFPNKALMRPRVLYVSNSRDVEVSGVTLKNSKFWTSHFYNCENVRICDCTIIAEVLKGAAGNELKGPSTDAVDVDKCRNVCISNCLISVNDDGVAIKGGKGNWADDYVRHPENGPSENILVTDCLFKAPTHSCLTLGSESPAATNIIMRNCRVEGAGMLLNLKMRTDTSQRYHGVRVEGCTGNCDTVFSMKPWVQYARISRREEELKSYASDVTIDNCRLVVKDVWDVVRDDRFYEASGIRIDEKWIKIDDSGRIYREGLK